MSELFLTILNMSLTASYVIIFLILIRLPLLKSPKAISYALWVVAAFRLVIPFSFESVYSLLPHTFTPFPYDIIYQHNPQINSGIQSVDSIFNEVLPSPTIGASVTPVLIYIELGAYIWTIGIVALIVYSFVSNYRLKKLLKNAQLIEQNIYEADNLKTPFVLGIISPNIYIPAGLNKEEWQYILLHEQTHISRKDHIIKITAFIILTIHWFNPLTWIAFMLMSMDMELSCDERVLKEMNIEIKKSYANSLLSLATGRRILNGSPLAFGEGNVKLRIKNVLNYKKPKFWVVVISIIVVIVVGTGLIANPKTDSLNNAITDLRPVIMVNGELYLDTGKQIPVEIDKSAIIGEISSSVDQSKKPTEEGQTNFGSIGSKYARFENNVVVLINNEWVLFEKETADEAEEGYVNTSYDKISAYLKEECINVFSPYYELLDFIISDYQEEVVNGSVEAIFHYKVIEKNYDRDPDTVEYIKEAKDRGDKNYQQLHDEYLQPREMNFYFKAVVYENGEITLFSKNPAINSEWEEVKISDYIVKNSEEVSETNVNLNKNRNELIENEIAEYITYNYENRSMYIVGLKIFDEFSTEEFGYINEGSVNINSENVLEFYIIYYTGSYIGPGTDIPGPEVRFKMNLETNEVVEKEFTPAPNYEEAVELYPEYIKPESIKYSEKIIELSDERMSEIGVYFKNYIFEIDAR